MSEPLSRWDEWFTHENLEKDERILAAPPSFSARRTASTFLDQRKGHILDVACGIGRDSFLLASQGLSVTGVDASYNGLLVANRNKSARNLPIDLVNADARCLPFAGNSFDGIYCFGLLHEFVGPNSKEDLRRVIDELRRVLCNHGMLAITAVSGDPQGGLPHVQLFTREMFEEAMAGWKCIEISEYNDVGCTGRTDYHIWYGLFEKQEFTD